MGNPTPTEAAVAGLWMSLLFATANALRVEYSQDFPLGSEIENAAIRPSGHALAVVYTFPRVYDVAVAAGSTPKLIYTFPNTNGVSSITESSTPDVFFVVTGNFSFETFSPTPGSYAIHRLSLDRRNKPVVKQLASLAAISQPNGIINVPGTPYVLIADTRAGFVYRFNSATLELSTYFDHPLLKPQPGADGVTFGVNGLKLSRGYLYFSNTNQHLIARVRATGREVRLAATPQLVAAQTAVDDFVVDDYSGDVYLAQLERNALGFVARRDYGGVPRSVLGGPNSTALLTPTSVRWAKGAVGRKLVVTVNGDFTQFITKNFTGGGRLAFVDPFGAYSD